MSTLSVIMPFYNAGPYIERSVRSLMNQTQKDIKYIFVNDCSTDNSLTILSNIINDYPKRKNDIVIISNQKNLGPSDSRKVALERVDTEYVGFCDADDWIEPDMYKNMIDATLNGQKDIVVCNYMIETGRSNSSFIIEPAKTPKHALINLDDYTKFSYAMWNQIVRTKIIKNEIKEIIPTKIREDTFLMMRIYYKSKTIAFIKNPFYHYWVSNPSSLIHNVKYTRENWMTQEQNIIKITNLLCSNSQDNKKYRKACNALKFNIKAEFIKSFATKKEYYYTFKDSHWDGVMHYNKKTSSIFTKIKMHLAYNTCFFIFNLLVK